MRWIKKFVKRTKLNTLNIKVNSLEKKIHNASTLIWKNQYNTGKQGRKKLEMLKTKFLVLVV